MANRIPGPQGAFLEGRRLQAQIGAQQLQGDILRKQIQAQEEAQRQKALREQQRQSLLSQVFDSTGAPVGGIGSAVSPSPDAFGTVPSVQQQLPPGLQESLARAQIGGLFDEKEIAAITQASLARGGDPIQAIKAAENEAFQDASRGLAVTDPATRDRIFQEREERILARKGDPSNTRFLRQLPFDQQTQVLQEIVRRSAGAEEVGKGAIRMQEERIKQEGRLELDREKFEREKSLKNLDKELQASDDKFEKALKIRNELQKQPQIQDFNKIESSFSRIQAAAKDPSPSGDLALIFNFMKMLDPGSVVRESEFATAQNAAGVPERIRNAYNNVIEGTRLSPKQRLDFTARAEKLFDSQEKLTEKIEKQFTELARDNGLSKKDVVLRGRGQPSAPSRTFTSSSGLVVEVE